MQTEEKKAEIRWADFDIGSPTSDRLTGSKVHAFKPSEVKYWIFPDVKVLGYSHTYAGNKSLCGKFRLYDEDERVVRWQDMSEHSELEIPKNKSICQNCQRISLKQTPKSS